MDTIPAELLTQINSLSNQQRYDLALELLDGVDESKVVYHLDPDFVAELDRRMESLERGETRAIVWDETAEAALRGEVKLRIEAAREANH